VESIEKLQQRVSAIGAVVTGSHVVYTSGRHGSEYFNKDALYPHTGINKLLCENIAYHFLRGSHPIEAVVGPEKGGIILSQWVTDALTKYDTRPTRGPILSVYTERREDSILKISNTEQEKTIEVAGSIVDLHLGDEVLIRRPGFVFKRGYDKLIKGKNVLVVEDVLTTGGSARRTAEAVRACGGTVVGLGVLNNRAGLTPEQLGVPKLYSVFDLTMESCPPEECPLCKTNVPINTTVGHGAEFLRQQAQTTAA
jgi:orotate phosphoribosyltransferase